MTRDESDVKVFDLVLVNALRGVMSVTAIVAFGRVGRLLEKAATVPLDVHRKVVDAYASALVRVDASGPRPDNRR